MAKKSSLDSLSHADIDGMDETTLRATVKRLLDARTNAREQIAFQKDIQAKDADIRSRLMPVLATVVEMLADKAGMSHQPAVQDLIKTIGDATYIQWHKGLPKTIDLPNPEDINHNPRIGEAEMVLHAPIHDAIETLMDISALMDIPQRFHPAIKTLVEAINEGQHTAITTGFKAAGYTPRTFTKTPVDANQAADRLYDLLTDLDFGMGILRTDLRAGMYRAVFGELHAIVTGIETKRREESNNQPKNGDEIPF